MAHLRPVFYSTKSMRKALRFSAIGIVALIVVVTLLFGHKDIPVEELKRQYAQVPSQFMEIEGMQVHYRDEGNPQDSLPLVLIHGTGASLHTFNDWTQALIKDRRVIRMDLPAFGLTGPFRDRDYSIEHYVAFLNKFLSKLNIESCILGGNSLGGQIAWNYTAEHPNQVHKLVLIDAAGYPKKSTSEPIAFRIAKIPVLNKALTYITPRFVIQSSIENVYAYPEKIKKGVIQRYFDLSLREGNRQAFIDRMQLDYDSSRTNNIKNIDQPTLILWGNEDKLITTESAYRFQADLANGTLVILKGSGHVPMEENPAESLEVLRSFTDKD